MKIPKAILERRRCVRVSENFTFKIDCYDGQDLDAETLNISMHGVMCRVSADIRLMTVVNISLYLPAAGSDFRASKRIALRGVVVRKDKEASAGQYLIAIYFSEIKPKDQKTLQQFIEARLKAT